MASAHVYSTAAGSDTKRLIDDTIKASHGKIDMHDETYLKKLIELASKRSPAGISHHFVASNAKGLQFFIIKGGAEGFLKTSMRGRDASRIVRGGGVTASGARQDLIIFDDNDLICVFDKSGKLISSALLRRPIRISTPKKPRYWTEATANRVYDAWDGQPVSLYFNRNFSVRYYGLWINDKLGYYNKGWVRIDLHKEEYTNGCIFIRDANTPPREHVAMLNAFEPKFIKDVQKAIGAKEKWNFGKMHMIQIR